MSGKDSKLDNLNVIVTDHLEAEAEARSNWGPAIRLGALALVLLIAVAVGGAVYGIRYWGYSDGHDDGYAQAKKEIPTCGPGVYYVDKENHCQYSGEGTVTSAGTWGTYLYASGPSTVVVSPSHTSTFTCSDYSLDPASHVLTCFDPTIK